MNPAVWCSFIRQPSGIATILLLALLLALGGQPCPKLAFADPAPSPAARGCCHHGWATSDAPADPAFSPCRNSPCAQAPDPYWANHEPAVNPLDWPLSPLANAFPSPPDWSGDVHPLLTANATTHPLPLQRSRVLRL